MASSTASSSPAPHKITVSYKNGEITVNPASITVDKTKNEHIHWLADGNFEFYVCFENETPFGSRHFHRQSNASGRARPDATGRYKYSVEVDGHTLDPDVIIRP